VTANECSELDPRSLAPDRSFWSAFDELVWGRTPPADFCNCYDQRALGPSSHDPRRDERRDALPFLTSHAAWPLSRAPSGLSRRAAHSPHASIPVPVPPDSRQVCPTAISTRARHLRRVARRSCSGDRGARVRGPSEGRVDDRGARGLLLLASGAWASKSPCGRRSLPRQPSGHPLSPVRPSIGEEPRYRCDGPTEAGIPAAPREGRRHPADRDAFHRRDDETFSEDRSTPTSQIGPSLTPPTRFPQVGEKCLFGPCKHHDAVTRGSWCSERRAPL